MTETEIKEMYKSLANGDEWECKCNGNDTCSQCEIGTCSDETWRPYKLGEAIHENFEYRKVEKWYVVKETNQTFTICPYEKAKQYNPIHFESYQKEECEKWIKEHTKTWLEENYPLNEDFPYDDFDINETRVFCYRRVCKRIFVKGL